MRRWYNIDGDETAFDDGAQSQSLSAPILLQDSESEGDDGCNKVLFQSDSDDNDDDGEITADVGHDDPGMMLQTSSEEESEIEEPHAKKRKYHSRSSKAVSLTFLGHQVCKRAHMQLYGIGSTPLQNLRAGRPAYTMHENRMLEPKHATLGVSLSRNSTNAKWPSVLSFFWVLYISVAEIMPTKFVMPAGTFSESFMNKDPDFEERYTRAFMGSIEKNFDLSPASQLSKGTCFFEIPAAIKINILNKGLPHSNQFFPCCSIPNFLTTRAWFFSVIMIHDQLQYHENNCWSVSRVAAYHQYVSIIFNPS